MPSHVICSAGISRPGSGNRVHSRRLVKNHVRSHRKQYMLHDGLFQQKNKGTCKTSNALLCSLSSPASAQAQMLIADPFASASRCEEAIT